MYVSRLLFIKHRASIENVIEKGKIDINKI